MATLTVDQLTRWRANPAAFPVHIWAHSPRVVFRALVNQATFTYPLSALTYDTVTAGAYTDIEDGMTLAIGTSAGAWDLGRVRLRTPYAGSVATATQVFFMRASQGHHDGELAADNNVHLTVYDLRMIWATPPYITDTGVIYKDSDIPFVEATHQPPTANAGPDVLKIVPVGTTSATVDFGQTLSTSLSPVSRLLTYAWDFRDGTPATSTDVAPTGVSFPLGKRYVRLTVTDATGVSHTAYALVVVADEADPSLLKGAEIVGHIERIEGASMRLSLRTPLSVSDYPDGAEVLVCTDAVADMEGLPDREHMVFAGWMADEDSVVTAQRMGLERRTTLTLQSAADRLKALPLWEMTIVRKETPTKWSELKWLALDRLVHHILHWHTTVLQRVDLMEQNVSLWTETYGTGGVSVPSGNVWEVARQYIEAQAGLLVCDRYNRLGMRPDEQLAASSAQQAALASLSYVRKAANALDLTQADFSQIASSFARHPRYHWVWSEALYFTIADHPTAQAPLFIVSPGPAPAQGAGESRITKQVVLTEPEFRWREGNRYAARESAMHGMVRLALVHPLPAIHPADIDFIRVTSDQSGGARVRPLSAQRFLPVEVSYTYDHRAATRKVSATLEREVIGWAAPTYSPPSSPGGTQNQRLEFPRPTVPNQGIGNYHLNSGIARITGVCQNGLARSANFGAGSATVWDWLPWSSFAGGAAGIGWTFVPDAFSYLSGNVSGWLLTAQNPARIYYVDIAARTWTLKHTWSAGWQTAYRTTGLQQNHQAGADASFGFQNHFVAAITKTGSGTPNQGVRVVYTTDNTTFTETDVSTTGSTSQGQAVDQPSVFVSSRTALKARTSALSAGAHRMYGTSDFATWTSLFSLGLLSLAVSLHVPWDPARNSDESIAFYGIPTNGGLLKRVNGTVVSTIGPAAAYCIQTRNGISSYVGDANRLLFCGSHDHPWNGAPSTPYLSNNALAASPSWTALSAPSNYHACAIAGDNGQAMYFWGGNYGDSEAVGYSNDGGASIVSQKGNLGSFNPGKVLMLVGW